ncbi:MAG: RnfH family protein [Natronospirillum sp.]
MTQVHIEVAFATPEKQRIVTLTVNATTTLREAVERSHIGDEFPDLDVNTAPLGIFGKKIPKPDQTAVEEGQRIEIYRPLLIDPKQARVNRAAKADQATTQAAERATTRGIEHE